HNQREERDSSDGRGRQPEQRLVSGDHTQLRAGYSLSGMFRSSSSSHTAACESEGARQSPRGDSEPPEEIFGPFGSAERLNWLCSKKRRRNTRSHCLILGRS